MGVKRGTLGHVVLIFCCGFLFLTPKAWPLDRIRISYSAISGSQAILWVTQDAGLFRKYDLDPQIIFMAGRAPPPAALVFLGGGFSLFSAPASLPPQLQGGGGGGVVRLLIHIGSSFFFF